MTTIESRSLNEHERLEVAERMSGNTRFCGARLSSWAMYLTPALADCVVSPDCFDQEYECYCGKLENPELT